MPDFEVGAGLVWLPNFNSALNVAKGLGNRLEGLLGGELVAERDQWVCLEGWVRDWLVN